MSLASENLYFSQVSFSANTDTKFSDKSFQKSNFNTISELATVMVKFLATLLTFLLE